MIIRLIIFFILVYLFTKLLKSLFLSSGKKRYQFYRNAPTGNSVDEMVQDPVCKLYIPKREAMTSVHSGTTYYFCSRECMHKFKSEEV